MRRVCAFAGEVRVLKKDDIQPGSRQRLTGECIFRTNERGTKFRARVNIDNSNPSWVVLEAWTTQNGFQNVATYDIGLWECLPKDLGYVPNRPVDCFEEVYYDMIEAALDFDQ